MDRPGYPDSLLAITDREKKRGSGDCDSAGRRFPDRGPGVAVRVVGIHRDRVGPWLAIGFCGILFSSFSILSSPRIVALIS